MKVLTLLRHAKSSWHDPVLPDFDRPLDSRGRTAAGWIGEEVRRRGMHFHAILASPARRVVETIELGELGARAPDCPSFDAAIYDAAPGTLLALLRNLDNGIERVLLVGHNPGLQSLALALCSETDSMRRHFERFPTGCLSVLALACSQWAELEPGIGEIELVLTPPREQRA